MSSSPLINAAQLVSIIGCSAGLAQRWEAPLSLAMARFQINTPARQAAFLAQIAHESSGLTRVVESLHYRSAERLLVVFPRDFIDLADASRYVMRPEATANRVYANQNGNGGEASGDGWRYRGRGPIQLTGRANYRRCGDALGLLLIEQPALLEEPVHAAMSAAWFWHSRGLNELADRGEFDRITRRINGGQNGRDDRRALWASARAVLSSADSQSA